MAQCQFKNAVMSNRVNRDSKNSVITRMAANPSLYMATFGVGALRDARCAVRAVPGPFQID